ncbi:MAG: hypothetical protein U5L45_04585 [Saprospiraceae bacterium]|nr:hypothetical protein [Saprospiraceae bacterium]
MRKITFFAAFAFVVLMSSTTIAATPTGLYDVILGSATTMVSVEATNVSKQTVNVQILNDNQEVLVNENFTNRADFIKKYDLAKLKDGDYQLIITKQICRITQPFMIDGGYVQLSELEKQTTFFPAFRLRNHKLDINLFSEKYGDIVVNVLNASDEMVHSVTYNDIFLLQKRFDFKALRRGIYKVQVIVQGESFFYEFER